MMCEELFKLCEDKSKLISKLKYWKVIPTEPDYKCPRCGSDMKTTRCSSASDGYLWFCGKIVSVRKQKKKPCTKHISIRTGTFFELSRQTMFQTLQFINLWVYNTSLLCIRDQIGVSYLTSAEMASSCREVLIWHFLKNQEMLGGENQIVEMATSLFGNRRKNRGEIVEGQWVVGGYERGTGRVFFAAVDFPSRDALLPIIKEWIRPGTTIISDCWKTYDCLESEGFMELQVANNLKFEDLQTFGDANGIRSTWRAAKAVTGSARKENVVGDLAKYMFQKHCRERRVNRMEEFLRLAGELFNPLKKNNYLPEIAEC